VVRAVLDDPAAVAERTGATATERTVDIVAEQA